LKSCLNRPLGEHLLAKFRQSKNRQRRISSLF
jgi:hypothetical protein